MTKLLSSEKFQKAREFVLSQARPIDRALFMHHFEGGAPEDVWQAKVEWQGELAVRALRPLDVFGRVAVK